MKNLIMLVFSFSILSCKKENPSPICENLTTAIISNNVETAKAAITNFVNSLPSQEYTQKNLANLTTTLSAQCVMAAELLCFSCIYTLPEQSEIKVSIIYQGSRLIKVFDITYTPDNKIKVLNMHD